MFCFHREVITGVLSTGGAGLSANIGPDSCSTGLWRRILDNGRTGRLGQLEGMPEMRSVALLLKSRLWSPVP